MNERKNQGTARGPGRDDRDGWQRQHDAGGDPYGGHGRGMGTRDYAFGQRDPMGREAWEQGTHGRAPGEQGYGSEYVGRDGYGPAGDRKRGKGPKNWTRSDERIRDEICERLAAQEHDWSDVEVHVSDGEATLTGSVRSREMRHEAGRVAAGVGGVKEVTNEIRVRNDAQPH